MTKNKPSILNQLWEGKSLMRAFMNRAVWGRQLSGIVVDVGGGIKPSYLKFFDSNKVETYLPLDLKGDKPLDLEKDTWPLSNSSADFVLMFNILEHVYDYRRVVGEGYRIIKPAGRIIGFVPFFINYHPDPTDYFRYTKESLIRILTEAGFSEVVVTPLGGGPLVVNYNNLIFMWPRSVRLLFLPIYLMIDKIALYLRPTLRDRFPLGFLFEATKGATQD